ncbi:MAG TPA: hypothetical protein VNI01_09170, partial [Elusimicrobiota bacterium]|nr:hypothetical protein [Elusimicrobiota bacterium]
MNPGGAIKPFRSDVFTRLAERKDTLSGTGALRRGLRDLRPHELALGLAGLAVLCLAPMLGYFLSAPEEPAGGAFNASGGPFLDAPAGIAPGADFGREGVVTALDAVDPLSLVRVREGDKDKADGKIEGKSAEKEDKPADSPPPTSDSWKDAITAAKAGAGRAISRASGLPRPSAKLEGQLRGLSALQGSGGGGGASSLAALPRTDISSRGLVGTPNTMAAMAGVKTMPEFRGSARGLSEGANAPFGQTGARAPSSTGAPSLLEAAGGAQSASGPAIGGRGLPDGAATANPSATATAKDTKTTTPPPQQENLALLRQKEEMEQSIKLKWDKKRYDQLERKKMVEQIATQTAFQTAQQAFLKVLDKVLNPNGQGQGQGQG